MSDEEIRTQIEHLISEYALKLLAVEAQLNEKNEDLRVLRKSFTLLEGQLAPAEQTIHDLTLRCRSYETIMRELEEQIRELSQLSGSSNARLSKLEHSNTSKFYAIILLCAISTVAVFCAFNNNSGWLGKIEDSLSHKLNSSATKQASRPSKQRKKRKASAAAVVSLEDSSDTGTSAGIEAIVETTVVKKDSSFEPSSAGVAN